MASKQRQVNLGELADQTNLVLIALVEAGFEAEVKVVRDFIHAEGLFFQQSIKTHKTINRELTRRIAKLEHQANQRSFLTARPG